MRQAVDLLSALGQRLDVSSLCWMASIGTKNPARPINSADLYLQAISTRLILRFSQLQPVECPRFIGRIGRLSILTYDGELKPLLICFGFF